MRRLSAALAACALLGCGQHRPVPRAEERARLAGGVVARVDGHAITAADVEDELRAHGGTPREAVERLVDARLLAHHAASVGYARRTEVERTVRRLSVQVLLARDVEAAVTPASITEGDVEEAYHQGFARFHTPERRACVQVLVTPPPGAAPDVVARARDVAEQARRALAETSDLDATLAEWQARTSEAGAAIRVERLPPVPADGTFVPEFQDALFAIDATRLPSIAPEPVHTRYGFHAVLLTGVEPERTTPLADVAPRLRAELLVRRRRERVTSLLGTIASRTPPHVDEAAFARTLTEAR